MKRVVRPILIAVLWLGLTGSGWMQCKSEPDDGSQGMTVTGLYRVPEDEGPFPAVILLPDCDGITPHERVWGMWLQSQGYAIHLIDSFFTRQIESVCDDPSVLAQLDDARGSLTKLLSLETIDPERIFVMGWQSGADTALMLAQEGPEEIRAVVVFYPTCAATPELAIPVIFVMPDQHEAVEACTDYMRREHQTGQVAVQRIAPYGVGAGFDCELCEGNYLGGPGGYDAAATELVRTNLLEEMERLAVPQ
ncbi:MAG: hypothetical protein HN577_20125 [Rhodospirillaceae bacterium]|nr:hypothetical protein [Rhodospirillaceae bacterium]